MDNAGRLAPVLLGLLFLFLAVWTWGRTAHPLVDYGREIYAPWRITEGAVLYKDLAYFNGPLSPYLNALWLTLFGVGLATLRIVNMVILAGVTFVIWKITRRLADAWTATLACALILVGMGFGHLMGWGTFNWIEPYSHEMTHGVGLSLLTVYLLMLWQERRRNLTLALAGLCLGLTFLTKPEIFLANAAACATGILLPFFTKERPSLRSLAVFAVVAVVPVAVTYLLLSTSLDGGAAWRGTLGGWPHVFNDELRNQSFYKVGMGTFRIDIHLERIAYTLAGWLVLFVPVFFIARRVPRVPVAGLIALAVVPPLALTITSSSILGSPQAWAQSFSHRACPALFLGVGAMLLTDFWRSRESISSSRTYVQRLTALALAFVLMGKMFFNVHVMQYGFGLTVGATIIVCAMMLRWLPDHVASRGGDGWAMRAPALVILVILGCSWAYLAGTSLPGKSLEIGEGADRFMGTEFFAISPDGTHDDAGQKIVDTLKYVDQNIPKDATLAVLPEGILWNYLLRRPSSVPHLNYMPPEIIMFGQENILRDFKANPPDYFVLVERETIHTYGSPFGDLVMRRQDGTLGVRNGYAPKLLRFVKDNYRRVHRIGKEPLVASRIKDGDFGTELWQRKK